MAFPIFLSSNCTAGRRHLHFHMESCPAQCELQEHWYIIVPATAQVIDEISGQLAQPWSGLVSLLAADGFPLQYRFERALNKKAVFLYSHLITSIRTINEIIS